METMAKKQPRPRRSFTPEFKAEVVELVCQPGNTAASVARDLGLTETAMRSWAKQADLDACISSMTRSVILETVSFDTDAP